MLLDLLATVCLLPLTDPLPPAIHQSSTLACVSVAYLLPGATPLFVACLEGHTEVVRLLLSPHQHRGGGEVRGGDAGQASSSACADCNRARGDGVTPLFAASQEGHADIAAVLLAAGADCNAAPGLPPLESPLGVAAARAHVGVVAVLLSRLDIRRSAAALTDNIIGSQQVALALPPPHPVGDDAAGDEQQGAAAAAAAAEAAAPGALSRSQEENAAAVRAEMIKFFCRDAAIALLASGAHHKQDDHPHGGATDHHHDDHDRGKLVPAGSAGREGSRLSNTSLDRVLVLVSQRALSSSSVSHQHVAADEPSEPPLAAREEEGGGVLEAAAPATTAAIAAAPAEQLLHAVLHFAHGAARLAPDDLRDDNHRTLLGCAAAAGAPPALVAVLLRLGARPAAVCDPRLGCIPGALAAHAGHTALAERLHRSAALQRAASSASFRGAGEALLFARRFPLPAELTLLVLSFCAADWF